MRLQHWLYKLPLRLRSLFLRSRLYQELDQEFRFHLDRQIEEFVAQGKDPDEARYAALRALGGIDQHKEAARDARSIGFIDKLAQDLRYAFRVLRGSLDFTTVAVITLAVGIGGITTIFCVVNGVLLRPLPYGDADRLIAIAVAESRDSLNTGRRGPGRVAGTGRRPGWSKAHRAGSPLELSATPRNRRRCDRNGIRTSHDYRRVDRIWSVPGLRIRPARPARWASRQHLCAAAFRARSRG